MLWEKVHVMGIRVVAFCWKKRADGEWSRWLRTGWEHEPSGGRLVVTGHLWRFVSTLTERGSRKRKRNPFYPVSKMRDVARAHVARRGVVSL